LTLTPGCDGLTVAVSGEEVAVCPAPCANVIHKVPFTLSLRGRQRDVVAHLHQHRRRCCGLVAQVDHLPDNDPIPPQHGAGVGFYRRAAALSGRQSVPVDDAARHVYRAMACAEDERQWARLLRGFSR